MKHRLKTRLIVLLLFSTKLSAQQVTEINPELLMQTLDCKMDFLS